MGVGDAKKAVEKKLSDQINTKQELLSKRQDQVSQQQLYLSLVNKLQESVRKNEALNKTMEKLEKQ